MKNEGQGVNGSANPDREGGPVEAMNGPAAPSQMVPDVDSQIGKIGTEGTREEEGGKENAGKPSGLDKGAREINGEAGGTHTSPGPSAQDVERFKQTQSQWNDHSRRGQNGFTDGAASEGLQVPGEGRPGMHRHYSVSQAMEPHLQMM